MVKRFLAVAFMSVIIAIAVYCTVETLEPTKMDPLLEVCSDHACNNPSNYCECVYQCEDGPHVVVTSCQSWLDGHSCRWSPC